jgi:2-polyprenyl-6-methoxyphenol hydroxylase-like FAD-dependent oxidoreductase
MGPTNFRVIVVGGGPVGLSCAHALSQAGIDFIILEQRSSFVIDAGANLILVPMSMRVLAQLGLLEELKQVSSPLNIINRMDHSGRRLGSMKWFLYDNE